MSPNKSAFRYTRGAHKAQALNYLKAAEARLSLLVNVGRYPKATVERIVS
ncbi:GxxExxY protein [Methylomicrobium lacus]